ncbi:rhodanese-related sulfurtransferase [Rhodobacter sp. JA431]|uniref:rhodanese-like domain-containing protein n=1 Tax=Rhodobacter sp. JA431 TaxID=570013 RepID=UPI000BC9FBEB|nr:rhodanese-like domain-containing protein [Rhodobacter sp. JA431]SOB98505.1 rhodanese-related sulfurtransferase [Rhodobacter sp. JA431]
MFNFLRPSGQGQGRVERIAPKDAVQMVAKGEAVLLDVRDGMELRATGKAKGALHVPMMSLSMKCDPSSPECLKELSLDKPVVLYCASGARSQGAGRMLVSMGYTKVFNLGGLNDWHHGGGQVVR